MSDSPGFPKLTAKNGFLRLRYRVKPGTSFFRSSRMRTPFANRYHTVSEKVNTKPIIWHQSGCEKKGESGFRRIPLFPAFQSNDSIPLMNRSAGLQPLGLNQTASISSRFESSGKNSGSCVRRSDDPALPRIWCEWFSYPPCQDWSREWHPRIQRSWERPGCLSLS